MRLAKLFVNLKKGHLLFWLEFCLFVCNRRNTMQYSPSVTILSASSVWTLVHCVVKYSRPPDLKSSSNVSLPFAWITGPATDPSDWNFDRKSICINFFKNP